MSKHAVKIIVADDHALFRAGLVRVLTSSPGFSVVAEAANAAETVAAVGRHEAHLLTLDLSMPGAAGTSVIEAVRAEAPQLPILVLSMHDEAALVRQALRSGATGYMTKNADPDTLLDAVAKIARGGRYVAPALAEALAFDFAGEAAKPETSELTARERQILQLIVEQGLALTDIAAQLDLSPKTVTSHKTNIMAKLGVTNNVELIRYVISHRLFG